MVKKGSFVDIHRIILSPEQRAGSLPADTGRVPLEMRVKGILTTDAEIGQQVEIETPIGRKLSGILVEARPEYTHRFGPPVAELQPIGKEVRSMVRQYRERIKKENDNG